MRGASIWCSSRLFLCFYFRHRVSLADLLAFGFINIVYIYLFLVMRLKEAKG